MLLKPFGFPGWTLWCKFEPNVSPVEVGSLSVSYILSPTALNFHLFFCLAIFHSGSFYPYEILNYSKSI